MSGRALVIHPALPGAALALVISTALMPASSRAQADAAVSGPQRCDQVCDEHERAFQTATQARAAGQICSSPGAPPTAPGRALTAAERSSCGDQFRARWSQTGPQCVTRNMSIEAGRASAVSSATYLGLTALCATACFTQFLGPAASKACLVGAASGSAIQGVASKLLLDDGYKYGDLFRDSTVSMGSAFLALGTKLTAVKKIGKIPCVAFPIFATISAKQFGKISTNRQNAERACGEIEGLASQARAQSIGMTPSQAIARQGADGTVGSTGTRAIGQSGVAPRGGASGGVASTAMFPSTSDVYFGAAIAAPLGKLLEEQGVLPGMKSEADTTAALALRGEMERAMGMTLPEAAQALAEGQSPASLASRMPGLSGNGSPELVATIQDQVQAGALRIDDASAAGAALAAGGASDSTSAATAAPARTVAAVDSAAPDWNAIFGESSSAAAPAAPSTDSAVAAPSAGTWAFGTEGQRAPAEARAIGDAALHPAQGAPLFQIVSERTRRAFARIVATPRASQGEPTP